MRILLLLFVMVLPFFIQISVEFFTVMDLVKVMCLLTLCIMLFNMREK